MSHPTLQSDSMEWVEANQHYVSAALNVLRLQLLDRPDDPGAVKQRTGARRAPQEATASTLPPPGIETVVRAFGLSPFERDLLMLCAGVELDAAVAEACAQAHGDPQKRFVTFGLALSTLEDPHWSALTPAAPLRHWRLIDVAHPDILTDSPLRINERVLHSIAGVAYLDVPLEPLSELVAPSVSLSPSSDEMAERLASLWASPMRRPSVQLCGLQRSDLLAVAAAAAARVGLGCLRLDCSDLGGTAADRDQLARICEREAALSGLAVVLDVDDALPENPHIGLDMARRLDCSCVLVSREALRDGGPSPLCWTVEPATPAESRNAWHEVLGPESAVLAGWIDRVVGQFELGWSARGVVADHVRPLLEARQADPDRIGRILWEGCRAQARPPLDQLTQRISPRGTWDDLVLPEAQLRTLHQITQHVRHRLRVQQEWGFAARSARGQGTTVLFSGGSGTGKTKAAEVMAAALGLEIFRIDLSQTVSKYIGETEKNLRSVFDAADAGGSVLLFDEADALFGKRTEVKDSHDRYANTEISYLLQRMEAYRGLAILTTNLKNAIDPAFLRRLRFVVQFPFPDLDMRAEIWRRVFPPLTPTQDLDPQRLASLTVTGGTIANIALHAAFLAAEDDEPVQMRHLLSAARTEYVKLERPLTDAEVRGWVSK